MTGAGATAGMGLIPEWRGSNQSTFGSDATEPLLLRRPRPCNSLSSKSSAFTCAAPGHTLVRKSTTRTRAGASMTDNPKAEDSAGDERLEDASSYTRREALQSVKKYAALVAGSATVVLTADEVLAKANCSRIGGQNGRGPPPDKGPPWCR